MFKSIKAYFQARKDEKEIRILNLKEEQELHTEILREKKAEQAEIDHREEHIRLQDNAKQEATDAEKPYLKVTIIMGKDNRMQTDVDFNKYAISVIDEDYQNANVDYYQPTMEDNGKLAIYLSDTLNTIAANYLPDEFQSQIKEIADEYKDDVPDLTGNFEKQVVDLGVDILRG